MPMPETSRHPLRPSRQAKSRRGAIVPLMAILLPVLVILCGLAINAAYMQLTRTELMVATDAASRAGGRALSEFQDIDAARDAAIATAALNTVAGRPLRLRSGDNDGEVDFGVASRAGAGRFQFSKTAHSAIRSGSEMATTIQVTGRRSAGSMTGPVQLIFPSFRGDNLFNVDYTSTTMQVDRDIALILDRSGSMGYRYFDWPPGFNPYSSYVMRAGYDAGILRIYSYRYRGRSYWAYTPAHGSNWDDYEDWVYENYLNNGPGSAPEQPWSELVRAVNAFLGVLESTEQEEQVSLATYSTSAHLDLELERDYNAIRNQLSNFYPSGATAIGEGLQAAMPSLLDTMRARPFAAKTIVVMTDGIHNTGVDPVTVVGQIVSQHDITIHSVTFGDGADINRMREVARLGGGTHYHAADGNELVEIFETIANNLPTLVIH